MSSAHAGFRGQRWPFGRLAISPSGLGVRTPGRRSIDLSVPREAVISISVGKGMYGQRLKIADTAGALAQAGEECACSGASVFVTGDLRTPVAKSAPGHCRHLP
ncbi:MAG TPA: hypothetical protein VNF47_23970 [Streptosporangiaceae bacterium]|nr:hypothetical protein [Streptosporangiaceae bacterium]